MLFVSFGMLIIIPCLILRIEAYECINQYINSTTIVSGVTITAAITKNSGQVAYVAMTNSSNVNIIRKYDLSTGSPQLMGQYQTSSSNMKTEKLFIYGSYLIGYNNA